MTCFIINYLSNDTSTYALAIQDPTQGEQRSCPRPNSHNGEHFLKQPDNFSLTMHGVLLIQVQNKRFSPHKQHIHRMLTNIVRVQQKSAHTFNIKLILTPKQ